MFHEGLWKVGWVTEKFVHNEKKFRHLYKVKFKEDEAFHNFSHEQVAEGCMNFIDNVTPKKGKTKDKNTAVKGAEVLVCDIGKTSTPPRGRLIQVSGPGLHQAASCNRENNRDTKTDTFIFSSFDEPPLSAKSPSPSTKNSTTKQCPQKQVSKSPRSHAVLGCKNAFLHKMTFLQSTREARKTDAMKTPAAGIWSLIVILRRRFLHNYPTR